MRDIKASRPVLFLLPYPLGLAPSQRFRIEAFFPILEKHGVTFKADCFLSEKAYHQLYGKGAAWKKAGAVLVGLLKRIWVVAFVVRRYSYIVIHRGAAPLGPPVFEWLIAKIWRRKIIYDFDDAIWIPVISEHNQAAFSLKCSWKVAYICKWAHHVVVGNAFLASFANKYNLYNTILPTCVDTMGRFKYLKDQRTERIVIGWTGTHSTMPFLDPLVPVLSKLAQIFEFDFVVISNQPPNFSLPNLQYIPWREATEIEDLMRFNIGLMPLENDAWSEGKCGFKIIQYLALGIPAVASPVGVNKYLVTPGVTGFLCNSEEDWFKALKWLLEDASLRARMGTCGKSIIENDYSLQRHKNTFLSLFTT